MRTMDAPEVVTRKGKPVSVILPIRDYLELVERKEDSADVAWLKKAKRRATSFRSLDSYFKK